jgi:peptide-methionine (R)-S-oxide reductase
MPAMKPDTELSEELYQVARQKGTEAPFTGEYWNNHEKGLYQCAVCGNTLFSSDAKFDSGTGWPSFTKPLAPANVQTKSDDSLMMARTEVRSTKANSHLGHLFDDGPADKGSQRYCINSAAMRFIPVADLEKEGYGEYKKEFEK